MTGGAIFAGANRRRWISVVVIQPNGSSSKHRLLRLLYPSCKAQWFSSGAESAGSEFSGQNAYELLGVSETSSFAEIKASFRKLAKETHPDLAESKTDSDSSQRFVQILAAYEILSDSEKRAHYDMYLISQRKLVVKQSGEGVTFYHYAYESHITYKQMEVVEWLKWYRAAIKDILSEKKVVVGTGYFDVLERDFYSAIHAAYYGPEIESMDFLPDCFEAEERSVFETQEVLHLVSGRDLFGMVCLVNKFPELSFSGKKKLHSSTSFDMGICQSGENVSISMKFDGTGDFENSHLQAWTVEDDKLHAYTDLELHLYGRVVAVATRVPPKGYCSGVKNEENQDHIHVFLNPYECSEKISKEFIRDSFTGDAVGSRIPLGTITGLGTSADEGSCFVYNSSGTKTHVIMKHRTLLVKHMHWYGLEEEVSVCECRCSRASLPPSKRLSCSRLFKLAYGYRFWLFEPRCGMHDIGGWYVETFGRDKKGRTIPSQRYWDGLNPNEQFEKRLHPAMYILALAYRTLDLEDAKIRKRTARDVIERNVYRILSWCKKLV
ncbi:Terminal organelle assembly protein [Trema orientale]|uniref:Terminal organelle assembly protein n=1 Tax=Trema orientale TaxID=63057 RepID=A0A2P5FSH2_TREOI|nr:Terminal organelle assembly protein [Trema orientale]